MSAAAALQIRFWGVRGSHPMPGRSTIRVGGNSSCVEIIAGGHTLALDAGTGIIGLGQDLVQRNGDPSIHIFLSHTHHDHIEGLRFFQPVYRPEWRCHVYGTGSGPKTLERVLASVMKPRVFPVSLSDVPTRLSVRTIGKRDRIVFRGSRAVEVLAHHSRAHPKVGVTLYRITCAGRSVVYATDVEGPKGGHKDVSNFARGADILIHDAQYTDEEYYTRKQKVGWGHSTVRMATAAAQAAGVGELLLFHHDPDHNDAEVRRLERLGRTIFPHTRAATEGMELRLPPR